jgi:hypothetical protein
VVFVIAWFIKEVPLRGRAPADSGSAEDAHTAEPELAG